MGFISVALVILIILAVCYDKFVPFMQQLPVYLCDLGSYIWTSISTFNLIEIVKIIAVCALIYFGFCTAFDR